MDKGDIKNLVSNFKSTLKPAILRVFYIKVWQKKNLESYSD